MRWYTFFACLVCLGSLLGCSTEPPAAIEITGATMGTSYSVKIVTGDKELDTHLLQGNIDRRLADISQLMSTYDEQSELMRLNRDQSSDCIEVSGELVRVIDEALRISHLAGGSFDITVGPLVNLWGFGPEGTATSIPTNDQIAAAMERTGFEKIDLNDGCLRKQQPDLFIDLSAIAKGYAVDQLAELLANGGFDNYMVEIGGEILARGRRSDERSWQVGIEKPLTDRRTVQKIVPLSGMALATSGDYRNYFEHDGTRFSHIIDANSGRPIIHNLVSVTVAHESCMVADALATAFMVLGHDRAIAIAETEGVAVMAIVKQGEELIEVLSTEFEALLAG